MKFAVVFFFMAISSCFGPSTALKLNIKTECLQKLLQTDLPQTLIRVHDLLCLYVQGKDAHNEVLYKRFLKELNEVLKDAGCTLDELLNTKNALETLGDEIGKVADEVAFEILKTVDDLEITGKVLDLGCQLVGKTLISLSDALSKLNVLPVKKVVGKVLKL